MKLNTSDEIREYLNSKYDFGECIIETIEFSQFATIITICLNVIWDSYGNVRSDLDQEKVLAFLEFRFVKTFSLTNEWTTTMLADPQSIGWGLNEVSSVRINAVTTVIDDANELKEIEFRWEGTRRMVVVFLDMIVSEVRSPVSISQIG